VTELPAGAVTFLFSDIEGSTRLVKALRERYAQVLAEHRSLVRAAIAGQAGHEIDTQGDAFFVAFASAKQAVLCALEVQRALAGHEWPSGASVRVRMGIHTGQATPVGGAYTGLAVHRAARICAAARGGQVLVSQATQTLIEDEEEDLGFALVELGERRLKDLDRPVRLFELAAGEAVPEPPARDTAYAPALAPIVGRAAELRIVSAAYARVMAGQSQVMLITGEAGIGKTRLVEELAGLVRSAADGTRVRVGESAPMAGTALAYGPFVAALGNEAGWLLADDREGNMLAARHRLFVRVFDLLTSLAARSPLVVVLEDLHWADESSRELLTFLAVRLRTEPVMIVGTLREEELTDAVRRWLSELEHRPRVTRLRLGRMPDSEIAGLVAGVMPAGTSPDHVAAVVAAADGNPLYARELANADPGGPPASITDAVLAKASALTPQARAVIDQVSVADGGMSHELLATTVKLSGARLLTAARAGVASGLLAPAGDGYAFPHALIRQVIYAQTLPSRRRLLHQRLAEALADQPGSDPGLLARHWQLAGCPDRAAAAALLAARRAVSVRAYPEAKKNYALALTLADGRPEGGPDLLDEAARAASWAGDPEQAAAWTADALAQSDVAAPVARARRLERLGRYRWETGDPRAAIDVTEQAMVILDTEPPSQLQARVLAALATRRVFLGEADAALSLVTKAMEVAQQTGADAVYAHGLATLGIIEARYGDLEGGLADLQGAFTLACRAGSVEDIIRAAANRVHLLYCAGRFADAVEAARAGRSAAAALGAPPTMTAGIGNNAAAALIASGRWAEADRLLAELIVESPTNFTRYLQLLQLELAVGRGQTERAADLAATLRKSPEDPRVFGPLHMCLAEQALAANDLAVAAAEVIEGLAALSGAGLAEEEMRLLAAGARLAADLAFGPASARPRTIPDGWDRLAATFPEKARLIVAEHGAGQPDLAAFGTQVNVEEARRLGRDTHAKWRAAAQAWRAAGRPYWEAYARLREAAAASRAGRREQATRALTACQHLATELGATPIVTMAARLGLVTDPGITRCPTTERASRATAGSLGCQASRRHSNRPPASSAPAAQAARTPRPCQGASGSERRSVVAWMSIPAVIGLIWSRCRCQSASPTTPATIGNRYSRPSVTPIATAESRTAAAMPRPSSAISTR
jgi:class 3 adenylate cyclase/tetratricopeptide (TPR) repeat protein